MGGGVGGGRLNARTALCVSPPLAGWGVRACFGTRRKKTCRDLVAGRAQTMAQVGSRRKKTCRFSWQAAEISWQAQHGGWRKLAQVEKEKDCRFPCMAAESAEISWQAQHRGWRKLAQEGRNCRADFVAGTAKRLKIAKSCFIFGFWTGFTCFSSEKLF